MAVQLAPGEIKEKFEGLRTAMETMIKEREGLVTDANAVQEEMKALATEAEPLAKRLAEIKEAMSAKQTTLDGKVEKIHALEKDIEEKQAQGKELQDMVQGITDTIKAMTGDTPKEASQ